MNHETEKINAPVDETTEPEETPCTQDNDPREIEPPTTGGGGNTTLSDI